MRSTILILSPFRSGDRAAYVAAQHGLNLLSDRIHRGLAQSLSTELCTVLGAIPEESGEGQDSVGTTEERLAKLSDACNLVYIDFAVVFGQPFACAKTIYAARCAALNGRKIVVLAGSENCLQVRLLEHELEQDGTKEFLRVIPLEAAA